MRCLWGCVANGLNGRRECRVGSSNSVVGWLASSRAESGRVLGIAVLGVFLYARVLSFLWGFDGGMYGVGVRGIIIIYSILYRGT